MNNFPTLMINKPFKVIKTRKSWEETNHQKTSTKCKITIARCPTTECYQRKTYKSMMCRSTMRTPFKTRTSQPLLPHLANSSLNREITSKMLSIWPMVVPLTTWIMRKVISINNNSIVFTQSITKTNIRICISNSQLKKEGTIGRKAKEINWLKSNDQMGLRIKNWIMKKYGRTKETTRRNNRWREIKRERASNKKWSKLK